MEKIPCPECDGQGIVEYEVSVPMSFSNPYGYLDTKWCECERCMGAGELRAEEQEHDDE